MPQQTAVSKPDHIVDAIKRGNKPYLTEKGKKGGLETQRRRRFKLLNELRDLAIQAHEDICPVGED